ncbi:MAG: DUF4330 domain-containing protein [Clostridia bacterium]|nr:DUF4330 domain-containing protein [Clostridia bacterium]
MIIDKKGKLFGKISVVDIAVVLIIVVLAVGIYLRFAGETENISTNSEKITCTFLVENVRMYTVDALKKGGALYEKTSKEYMGEVTDVKWEEGLYQVNMADGSFKKVVPEERYNVYVTIEFDGKVNDGGFYTAANKYLAVGSSVGIHTKYSECWSTVYSIGVSEEK